MDIVCITHTVICTTYNKKKRVGLENEQEKGKRKKVKLNSANALIINYS